MKISGAWMVWMLCCALIALIGFADLLTAERLSLYVFYAVPIFLSAWFAGRLAGILLCVIAVFSWMIVDLHLIRWQPWIVLWNAVLRMAFFAAISIIISSLKCTLDREKESARVDFLTGLPNRRTFLEIAIRERERAIRHKRPLTLAYIDLDDFKEINDRSGHDIGDHLLKEIASALRSNIRNTDLIARIGGDEFVMLLPETDFEAGQFALRKLQEAWKMHLSGKPWSISLSIGAMTYTDRFPDITEMIQSVDRLMYEAKAAGKNRILHKSDRLSNRPDNLSSRIEEVRCH
jgi:diguanylate cyclase (GGDEF)-like protein